MGRRRAALVRQEVREKQIYLATNRQNPEGLGLQPDSCATLAQYLTCEIGVVDTEADYSAGY
jgi:hypothetical protein